MLKFLQAFSGIVFTIDLTHELRSHTSSFSQAHTSLTNVATQLPLRLTHSVSFVSLTVVVAVIVGL